MVGAGMGSLMAVAALTMGPGTLENNSMRIIQRPTAKKSREKAETQGKRNDRVEKCHRLKGIRP
jgi:hypothetical protein